MKLRRRIGSVFLAFAMALSLIPSVAVSALAATGNDSKVGDYVTLNYSTGNANIKITVNVFCDGTQLESFTVNDGARTDNNMSIHLNDGVQNTYDIENATIDPNPGVVSTGSSDNWNFSSWSVGIEDPDTTINVYLCPQYVEPEIVDPIDTLATLHYQVTQPALLKLLHDNGVDVTADTKITNQQAVKLHFVEKYGNNMDWSLNEVPSAADNLQYYQGTLSDVSDKGNPENIRYIEITYTQSDGNEYTKKIYSGNLRYVNVGNNTYEIESRNQDEHIVIFYTEGQTLASSSWTPYSIRFVQNGQAVGTSENDMPTPPEYPTFDFVAWTQQHDGGLPVIYNTLVFDDMAVYPQYKSSASNSTLIHVMNNDELLQNRIAELFDVSTEEINWNSIEITVHGANGEETNPDYGSNPGIHNGWESDYDYFRVYNYSTGAGDYENEPIYVNDIVSISIEADKIGGTHFENDVVIEKGPYAGDFSISTGSHDASWLIELYINAEGAYPEKPDDPGPGPDEPGEAQLTVEKTVAIDGEEVSTASVGDTLEYTITVTNSGDAAAEDVKVWDSMWTDQNGAVLVNGTEPYVSVADGFCTVDVPTNGETTIYYTYTVPEGMAGKELTNNVWIGEKDDNPDATATVKVDEEQPEVPDAPDEGDIPDILGEEDAVLVKCVSDETHANKDKVYNLWPDGSDGKNRYDVDNVTDSGNGEFTCTVTILPGVYVEQYNTDTGLNHWLVDKNAKAEITLTWNADSKTWTAPEKAGDYWATFQVTCKPDAPADDDIPTILGSEKAVLVKCVSNAGHELTQKYYNLVANDTENTRYQVGDVVVNEDGTITCTVTILPGVYVARYNEEKDLDGIQHKLVTEEAQTVILSWTQADGWTAPAKEDNIPWAVFNVECAPDAPTTDDLNELFPNGVQVDCISQSGHPNKDFSPVADDTYTTTVEQKDGKWTCKVIVTGETYVEKYEGAIGWPHTANDDTRSVTLVWENGKWAKQDNNNVMVVFDVTCQAPDAPTYDQLKGLFKVQIDCITSDKWGDQYEHKNKDYDPIEGSYTLGNVTANADGTWDLEVTVAAEKYVAQYSADRNETHTLADAYSSKTVTLVYQDDGTWSKPGDNIAFAFDVKCNPKYDLVYHGCGGFWEGDEELDRVSSTFPYFGEATIKRNEFVRDGYVFEGWALTDGGDVVYTGGEDVTFNDVNFPGLSENKGADLYAVWALDKQGEIDPDTGEETGDGIADYRQVFVRYKSADATLGSVAPAYQVVTLDLDKNGDPIVVDISLDSVATANEGAEFIYWMQGPENTVSYEASLKNAGLTLKNYTPGYTYEFTAYFMDSDIGKPEPVQTYKIDVDVTNGTGTFFGAAVTTHILAREGEDITIAFAPDAGYALDTVTVDGEPAVLTADGTYTFPNVAANHSITVVYATDAWNDKDDTTTGGDGIPDKYQVVVKYVAGKGGKITGKQVEVLTITVDGHYSTVGDVTATGSQAAASHNWDFSRWVAPNGGVAGWNPTLDQQIIKNAVGGGTYVFTALFRYDPYTPPVVDPDPDDPTPPPVNPNPPQLNTEDHYAYIVGYEDGTVRPEGDITRAEVATIFFRLLTDESRNEYWSQTNDYIDVAEGDWYNNAVSTLSKAGILNGYEDGSFRPNGNITRAEFATIAARFFEATYEGEDLFPDIEGHWARDYINQAAHAGIVNGYEDGTFRPQDNITRAEAMTIVNRTLDRHPDADHFLADMITWPDNPETAWYYEQVQEATNSHEYVMMTDKDQNRYEDWTKLLEIRDWSDLENTWSEAHAG